MAEVYDHVPGIPGSRITRTLPNGDVKTSKANQLERVIALHEDVQNRLIHEGRFIARRADFRLKAHQERHIMRLREILADALKEGDPEKIKKAQADLDYYYRNRTQVTSSHADVDYHIHLFREDGNEFHVEEQGGGLHILRDSLND